MATLAAWALILIGAAWSLYEALSAETWLAVSIACGCFIAAVFIGVAVSAWRERQRLRP